MGSLGGTDAGVNTPAPMGCAWFGGGEQSPVVELAKQIFAYPMTDPWLPGIPTYTFTIKINQKCIGRCTSPMDPS